jgi:hypothetical protein
MTAFVMTTTAVAASLPGARVQAGSDTGTSLVAGVQRLSVRGGVARKPHALLCRDVGANAGGCQVVRAGPRLGTQIAAGSTQGARLIERSLSSSHWVWRVSEVLEPVETAWPKSAGSSDTGPLCLLDRDRAVPAGCGRCGRVAHCTVTGKALPVTASRGRVSPARPRRGFESRRRSAADFQIACTPRPLEVIADDPEPKRLAESAPSVPASSRTRSATAGTTPPCAPFYYAYPSTSAQTALC